MDYRKEREKADMTQIEVANAVGVSVGAYRLWEQGGGKPSDKNREKIEKVFHIETP
jgi:transcriptional regulator with XRE-family HTH domain